MVELITILLVFMIIGALFAVETQDLLSSIIIIGAVGAGLSIAFLFLGAPDIAITLIVVEVLCLVILIRATISRDLTTITGEREFLGFITTVVLIVIIFLFSDKIFRDLPELGTPIIDVLKDAPANTYIRDGLGKTGAANIVASVILDFRAYDTLGEATVLFTAIIGALAILREKARKKRDEIDQQ